MWYVVIFILGIIVGSVKTISITSHINTCKEQEAYREGYEAGVANANKKMEV